MKTIMLACLAVCSLFYSACNKETSCSTGSLNPLRVDLQTDYQQAFVQVFIDGGQVYSDTTTTEGSLGLAASIRDTIQCGGHQIKVIVNNHDSAAISFTQKSELYIGVTHHPVSGKVSFDIRTTPFLYL